MILHKITQNCTDFHQNQPQNLEIAHDFPTFMIIWSIFFVLVGAIALWTQWHNDKT